MTSCPRGAEVWAATHGRSLRVLLIGLAIIASAQSSIAQPMTCYVIRAGDTVAEVAQRMTGNAESRLQPWFQVADPATSRFVPKAQYRLIRPGWRACISGAYASTTARRPPAVSGTQSLANLLSWMALLGAIALAGWLVDDYFRDRQAKIGVLAQFGGRFVREFERPLIQRRAAPPPLQSRLRVRPQHAQLEVLLAPAAGHRYPNLSDHKRNVEYNIARVLQTLREDTFVGGRPFGEGQWVVVPFQLMNGQIKAGGR